MIVYTTNCPKCMLLEKKLKEKNIKFEKESDIETIMLKAEKFNLNSVPFIEVDKDVLPFEEAMEYIKGV